MTGIQGTFTLSKKKVEFEKENSAISQNESYDALAKLALSCRATFGSVIAKQSVLRAYNLILQNPNKTITLRFSNDFNLAFFLSDLTIYLDLVAINTF